MRRTWAIARKEFIHLRRDPRSLGAAVVLPVALLLLYGFAVDFDLKTLPIAVVDLDHTQSSRRAIEAVATIHGFRNVAALDRADQAESVFTRREAMAVLVVPSGFEANILARRAAPIQVLVDGADSTMASTAVAYLQGAVESVGARLVLQQVSALGYRLPDAAVDARVRVLYNPELKSRVFLVPGLVAIILMLMAALLTSGTVVRERERGTFELLAASPLSPLELLVGKLLPYWILASIDVVLAVATGWVVFGVVPRGSLPLLFAVSSVFVASALALGLFFSCKLRTQQLAFLVSFITTVLPTMLLSGFAFPVRNMPRPLQWVAQIMPATHYIPVVRAIVLKGSGWDVVQWRVGILSAITVLLAILALRGFRKTI
jgi:ABC-2 type transport system permease protein